MRMIAIQEYVSRDSPLSVTWALFTMQQYVSWLRGVNVDFDYSPLDDFYSAMCGI